MQRTDLRRYLSVLLGDGIANASVRRKVSTIRSFYKWMRQEGKLENDPFFGVTGPKAAERLPDILTSEDIDRMTAAADGREPADLRDRALLELLYAAGLRVSEAASLDVSELDVRDRSVRVQGKGKKERIGVFGEPAATALDRYLHDGRPELASKKGDGAFSESVRRASNGPFSPDDRAQVRDESGSAAGGAPTPAAPQLRYAPAGRWRRPARCAGAAGAREPQHDADLHPRLRSEKARDDGGSVRGLGAH